MMTNAIVLLSKLLQQQKLMSEQKGLPQDGISEYE